MTIDYFAKAVFLLSTIVFAYHHFGFPLLLRWMAKRERNRTRNQPAVPLANGGALPSMTIIVPAYNEQALIGEKIRNLLALDYPTDRLRVVIALDGCTDETAGVATTALNDAGNPSHFDLQINSVNRGKLALLNDAIGKATSDVVVLSDVSAVVDRDALLRGAAHFDAPEVGVVCGTYRLKTPGSKGEAKYWQLQTSLKSDEAAVAAPMGAHGAFYMFRRAYWTPLAAGTVNDDFVLPMKIVAAGFRGIYDENIVAWELEKTGARQDFSRRVRIGAGNMQQLILFAGLLNPLRRTRRAGDVSSWRTAFVFGSGKALRVLVPFVALTGVVACVYLALRGYGEFLSIAISGLIVAGIGVVAAFNPSSNMPKPIAWLGYLLEGHFATMIGAFNYMSGKSGVAWSAVSEPDHRHREYIPFPIRFGKRAFDIVFSVLGLLLLWPFFLPIALAVKLESRGPVFYRQRRVGRIWGDRVEVFDLIKFRTMYQDAEARAGAQWATKNDPRITRVGLFLRKTRLDELPQFINVIRGDMSLIGPRPERPQLIGGLENQLPLYTERTYGLRPGITGLAQINQGYDESIDDVRNKLLFDHAYAAHLSQTADWLKMDFQILFGTVWVMVTGRGQ